MKQELFSNLFFVAYSLLSHIKMKVRVFSIGKIAWNWGGFHKKFGLVLYRVRTSYNCTRPNLHRTSLKLLITLRLVLSRLPVTLSFRASKIIAAKERGSKHKHESLQTSAGNLFSIKYIFSGLMKHGAA